MWSRNTLWSNVFGTVLSMNLELGFNLSAQDEARVCTVVWIWERWQVEAPSMSFSGLFVDLGSDDAKKRMGDSLQEFASRGWIELSHAPYFRWEEWVGEMTPSGRDVAEDLDRRRTSPDERDMKSRDASLYWLHNETRSDQGAARSLVLEAMGTYGYYLGSRFTENEIFRAGKWLEDGGYVKSVGAWTRELSRPELTRKGLQVVEQKRSVNDLSRDESSVGGSHFNFNGPVGNVAAHSSNFTQSAVISINPELANVVRGLAELLTLAHERIADVDEAAGGIARQAAGELLEAVSDSEAAPGVLSRALGRVMSLGGTVASRLTIVNALVYQAGVLHQQLSGH